MGLLCTSCPQGGTLASAASVPSVAVGRPCLQEKADHNRWTGGGNGEVQWGPLPFPFAACPEWGEGSQSDSAGHPAHLYPLPTVGLKLLT